MKLFRLVLVAVALACLGAVGLRPVVLAWMAGPRVAPTLASPEPDPVMAAARLSVRAAIAEVPDYRAFFERLQAAFPAESVRILDAVARETAEGTPVGADALMTTVVRALRQSRGILAGRADEPALTAIFAAQSRMMGALADADPRLCVDFLYGGVSPSYAVFSATHRSLVAALADAGLAAMAEGRARPDARAPPVEADFQLLEAALQGKGLNPDEIAALLDGRMPDPPIPDGRLCQIGRLYLDAMRDLPVAPRLRLYGLAVEMIARS